MNNEANHTNQKSGWRKLLKPVLVTLGFLGMIIPSLVLVWLGFYIIPFDAIFRNDPYIPASPPIIRGLISMVIIGTTVWIIIKITRFKFVGKARFKLLLWLMWLVVLTGCLFAKEYNLRRSGYYPNVGGNGFIITDKLEAEQMELTDSNGMSYYSPRYMAGDSLRHINAQGFVSNFNYTEQTVDSFRRAGKKIVLVIGDSFVEGYTSGAWDQTFVQVMNRMQHDYVLFSFGVSGMDPLQYKLVLEKYKVLHPDMVVVVFCGANDIMPSDRKPTPGIPTHYQTKTGWYKTHIPCWMVGKNDSILPNVQVAYQFYMNRAQLPQHDVFAAVCKHLAITTEVYRDFKPAESYECHDALPGVTYQHLHAIDSICQGISAKFAILVTPDGNNVNDLPTRADNEKLYGAVFKDILPNTYFILGLKFPDDYISYQNQHFNEKGNLKFAMFGDSIIRQYLKQPIATDTTKAH